MNEQKSLQLNLFYSQRHRDWLDEKSIQNQTEKGSKNQQINLERYFIRRMATLGRGVMESESVEL